MVDLPKLALSVRQPWAWAIIHAGKDIENRSWALRGRHPSPNAKMARTVGRVAIHASSGMTRDEYEDAADTIESIVGKANACPAPALLVRGGIIGTVEVVDVVEDSRSPWFFGPVGLVLRNPVACEPVATKGALGFFEWRSADGLFAPPAKWMLPQEPKQHKSPKPVQIVDTGPDLFAKIEH